MTRLLNDIESKTALMLIEARKVGNKAAAVRSRKLSSVVDKLLKQYRAESPK